MWVTDVPEPAGMATPVVCVCLSFHSIVVSLTPSKQTYQILEVWHAVWSVP